jgi:uncharacterized protein (DUF2141 family)
MTLIGGIMGSIFVSGTGCALLISALALSAGSVTVAADSGVTIDVSVSGLRNVKGQLLVCLTKNPKAFPDCSKDASTIKKQVPAAQAGAFRFEGVAPGTYAIAIVHDENRNNKMDLSLFIPKEGFAFSRNPTITVGPPKFKSAAFVVGSSDISQSVKMKYMF